MGYAAHFAFTVWRRLPIILDLEDMKSEAMLAMVTVAAKFEKSRGLPFAGVAKIRIRGALSDYLRKHDPMNAAGELEDVHTVETIVHTYSKASELVRAALLDIPIRERVILTMRYGHGLSHDRIAKRIGLSSSRVWQLDQQWTPELKLALARRGIRKVADIL